MSEWDKMEAAPIEKNCVYHDDRYLFDVLVRDMRVARLLTRQQAKVMAMAVCSCRRKATYRQPISAQEVHDAVEHVTAPSSPLYRKLTDAALNLLTSAALTARHHRDTLTSQARLIVVISQALQDDVTLLREEKAARQTPTEKKKPISRLSREVLKKLIQKRKRRLPMVHKITLPIFGGSSSLLWRNHQVGKGFSALRAKFPCVLEMDSEATAQHMERNEAKTVVKLWFNSMEVHDAIVGILVPLARSLQASNEDKMRRERMRRKHIARLNRTESMYWMGFLSYRGNRKFEVVDEPQEYKENLTWEFEKKEHKKQRNGDKSKSQAHKSSGSSIAQGHCLHCLLTYKEFKAAENEDDVKECRHHPGYVTSCPLYIKTWTCCDLQTHSSHPTHEEHAHNGCTVTRHCWRPHRKAVRDVGAKATRCQLDYPEHRMKLDPRSFRPLIY